MSEEVKRPRGDVTFTANGKLVLIIVIFLYAQAYSLNNLAPALLATLLLAYAAFARMSFNEQLRKTTLQAARHSKGRVFQDQPFPASLEIYNASPHALWLEVEDLLPSDVELASGTARARQVIEPDTSGKIQYMLRPIVRGTVTFDRFRTRLMDERGLMSVEIEDHTPHAVEVEPPMENFRKGEVLLRRDYISGAGSTPSTRLGRGYEFGGIRQYVSDDSSASIEWKASSRLAKLMTKLMHEETRSSVYIFLDSSRSMRIKQDVKSASKLDQSVYLAVQMAIRLSKAGFPVGMGVFDEHKIVDFEPPGQGRMSPADLLSTISRIPKSQLSDSSLLPRGPAPSAGSESSQVFLSKILPFFGRPRVSSSEKAAGIYSAVERLTLDRVKGGVILIFSDLQTNPKSVILSCRIMLGRGHKVIVVTPFSPAFDAGRGEMTVEGLERMYLAHQAKKALMRRLERMGVQVIEVGRGKEAAAEISARLSGR